MDQQGMSASRFGAKAANYLTSAVHATGADLERLETMAGKLGPRRALDLGCGAGHVSFALAQGGARRVTAYDPSPEMLEVVVQAATTRGLEQIIDTCAGAAEAKMAARANWDFGLASHSIKNRPPLATVVWSRSVRTHGMRWMTFMPRRSRMAEVLRVLPVFDCTMARISTRPMCEIRMEIKWPRFAVALQNDSSGSSAVSMRPRAVNGVPG